MGLGHLLFFLSFFKPCPFSVGLFGKGVLFEEGDECIVEGDSMWVSSDGCVDTPDEVEERRLAEVPVSLQGEVPQ